MVDPAHVTSDQQQQYVTSDVTSSDQLPIIYVVNQPASWSSGLLVNYWAKSAAVLAALQFLNGTALLAIIFASSVYSYEQEDSYNFVLLPGLYDSARLSAFLWIVAGSLGIVSACVRTKGSILATMVLSLLSLISVICLLPATLMTLNLHIKAYTTGDGSDSYEDSYYDYSDETEEDHTMNPAYKPLLAMNSWIVVFLVSEGVVAITAFAICCKAIGCCRIDAGSDVAKAISTTRVTAHRDVVANTTSFHQSYPDNQALIGNVMPVDYRTGAYDNPPQYTI